MKRKMSISAGLFPGMFCLFLTACGSSTKPPASQMTEIVPAETTVLTEDTAATTVQTPPVTEQPSEVQTAGRETTTAAERTTTERTDETTVPTAASSSEDETGMPVTSETVTTAASVSAEPVRVVITTEEIMLAAGIPQDEMLSGALDVEDITADAGTIMVSRERPWIAQDQTIPDWVFRVTEITVEGLTAGETVTVTGTAVDYEYEPGAETEEWYAARRVPFSVTKTAGT